MMVARRLVMALTLSLVAGSAAAGEESLGPICTDRPGKGIGVCTVERGHVQLEIGLADQSWLDHTHTTSAGSLLAGYGVTDNFDIEAGINLYQAEAFSGGADSGLGDLFLHAKWAPKGDGAVHFLLDPYLKLPTAAAGLGNGKVEGGLAVPMTYDLGGGWALDATPQADVLHNDTGTGLHIGLANTFGVTRSFSDGLTFGVEGWRDDNWGPFGDVAQESVDLDVAFLTSNDTQLDGGVNFGLNRATPGVEIYAGISRRF